MDRARAEERIVPFIEVPADRPTEGPAAAMFDVAEERFGYVPNMVKVFAHRPDVMAAWEAMNGAIKGHMDLRRYELVTLAAARELRSSYCMLAHGSVLLSRFFSAEEIEAIVRGNERTVLDETDRAIMVFAAKVVRDASSVTQADVDLLRAHGLSDAEIVDVTTAAAVRCFFSKTLDALGAMPDARYREIEPALRGILTVGRPIQGEESVAAE